MAYLAWLNPGSWLKSAATQAAYDAPAVAPLPLATLTDSADDVGDPVSATAPPNDGVVYIAFNLGSQAYQASGVLISPDEVLTASHVAYQTGVGVATDIVVSSGYNGYGGYATSQSAGTVAHYNPIDDANGMETLATSQSDYAIIHLAHPFTGVTAFSLISDYGDTAPQQTVTATTSGYPGERDGVQIGYTGYDSVDPGLTLYGGASLGEGSSGGPVWITNTDGQPTVIGLVSSYDPDVSDDTVNGNDVQITAAVLQQIESWVAQDDGTGPALTVSDTSNGEQVDPHAAPYSGPVAGLSDQYLNISADNLNVTANTASWFIHTGSGEDAIAASGGTNVLDGGTGSNFLVGGSGTDTFFTDDRNATASIWDTIANFHAGDAATIFGVTQAGFSLDWVDGEGAAGYTGLTLHAMEAGKPEASITLSGFTSAALTNGQLSLSYGSDGANSPYLYIYDKG